MFRRKSQSRVSILLAAVAVALPVQGVFAGNWTFTSPSDNQMQAWNVNLACSGTGPNGHTATLQALDKDNAVVKNVNVTGNQMDNWNGTLDKYWETNRNNYTIKLLVPAGDVAPANRTVIGIGQ